MCFAREYEKRRGRERERERMGRRKKKWFAREDMYLKVEEVLTEKYILIYLSVILPTPTCMPSQIG
jgi:hypothetical protein